MHKIVFLDRATIAPQIVLRRPGFEHAWIENERTSAGDVCQRLAGATIAIGQQRRAGFVLIAITFQETAVARLAILTLFISQTREYLHSLH